MLYSLLSDTAPTINIWSFVLPIILSSITAILVVIVTRLFDKSKGRAEEKKLASEAKKLDVETEGLEIDEWRKLYAEIKVQYSELKKEFESKIDTADKQISNLSASVEIQKEITEELQKELATEKLAREKLEAVLKKFHQWAVRNRMKLEEAKIEAIPFVDSFY
jgi:hypothetical protein